jgi:hypothetical protein
MAELSYATERKKRIIEEELGSDWKNQHPSKSIDAIYNIVTGDSRKNLFCKVSPAVKTKLDEMVDFHDINMAELVERLVLREYSRYELERDHRTANVASQYATTG